MRSNHTPEATAKTMLDALQGINTYLSTINSRLKTLLLSELPDYAVDDLAKVYEAEQEASEIVRSLRIYCHKYL